MAGTVEATPSHPHPRRALGLFSVLCIGINAIIGSGIFRLPGRIVHYLDGASWIAFGLVGLLLIAVGLCFAEMSGMFDASGGPYVYAREAFGRGAAFVVGWMAWVTMVVSWAAVANGITGYAQRLAGQELDPWLVRAIVASLILLPGVLNYFGVRPGAYATNTFTVAKIIPLVVFVAVGIFFVDWGNIRALPPLEKSADLLPLGAAMFATLFALQGFEVAPVPAGETANPRRNVPIAVIGSLIGCTIFYVLIMIVASGTEPAIASNGPRGTWSAQPLADSAHSFMGANGATFLSIAACISMLGFCVGSGLATPRFLGVLAEDGLFPKWLAALHPRFGSPHHAILFTTVVAIGVSQISGFDALADFANVAVTLQYVATCAAVVWLRRTRPDAPRSYRIPLGPYVVPLFGIGVCALLLSQAGGWEWIRAGVVIVIGVVLALLNRTLSRRPA